MSFLKSGEIANTKSGDIKTQEGETSPLREEADIESRREVIETKVDEWPEAKPGMI